jgi:hypothetical protein
LTPCRHRGNPPLGLYRVLIKRLISRVIKVAGAPCQPPLQRATLLASDLDREPIACLGPSFSRCTNGSGRSTGRHLVVGRVCPSTSSRMATALRASLRAAETIVLGVKSFSSIFSKGIFVLMSLGRIRPKSHGVSGRCASMLNRGHHPKFVEGLGPTIPPACLDRRCRRRKRPAQRGARAFWWTEANLVETANSPTIRRPSQCPASTPRT